MALITCPDCKKAISAEAQTCPKCGRPLTDEDRKKTLPGCGKWFLWICGLSLALTLGVAMCSDKEQKPKVENTAPAAPASVKTFDMKPQDFVSRFNAVVGGLGDKRRLSPMTMKSGSVNDVGQTFFGEHSGFTVASDKASGKVLDISLLGTPNGTNESSHTILMAMGGLVMTVNPELDKAGRSALLRDLGLTQGSFPEKSEAVRGGVRYTFLKLQDMGLMLIAAPI